MRTLAAVVLVLMSPALARAQQASERPAEEKEWVAPPLVETPTDESAGKKEQPPPPPPAPARAPPGTVAQPQAPPQTPGPEVGLMVSEALFGMLTASGTTLLAYYLFLKSVLHGGLSFPGADPQTVSTVSTVLVLLAFSGVPLATAQTQVGIANGSHYYSSEGWPAALSGLGAEAAVLGLYFLVRGSLVDEGEAVLLIGTCAAVPLVQMAVINLTKTPRWQLPGGGFRGGSVFMLDERGRVRLGVPLPLPALLPGARGPTVGAQLSLLGGRF
jgi:hypothetical protein